MPRKITLIVGVVSILGAAAAVYALRRPALAFTLASDVTIPFTLASRHVFLDVTVNGSRPLSFALDTGDKFSVIDVDRARELGLALHGNVTVRGVGPQAAGGAFVRDAAFTVRGLPGFSQPVVLAIPLQNLAPQVGHDFDGILGADFISQFVVTIDYQRRVLTLHDRETFTYAGSGTIVPIRFDRSGHPVIDGEVTPTGGRAIKSAFVLDVGDGAGLTLFSPFVAEHHLPGADAKTMTVINSGGTGGDTRAQVGRVAELKMGEVAISRPITHFSEDASGTFASADAAGNIGAEILTRFRLLLDYGRHRIIFEPAENAGAPFDRGITGLRLTGAGTDYRTLRIAAVNQLSPAADAGLQADDVITTIDARPASALTLETAREMLERPVRHTIDVRRGERSLSVALTPRRID